MSGNAEDRPTELDRLDTLLSGVLAAARSVAFEVQVGRLPTTPELTALVAAVEAHEQWRGGARRTEVVEVGGGYMLIDDEPVTTPYERRDPES